ncbi:aldehyde dehydrogenase family protein [Mycobacterium sp. CVI_P3]|uniref:aldehyde dehydrogenase (NAD(+)) n=1 Tax=Mycobacterium pinniadriaticum TaxID=2994102 RepID=A0ABT3SMW3_9MYCO|nr:aldehyde dehydrogenase family protein [Mycobacterium pinniadriaticum]MCX2934456.1 aldehyde dehydrogenase family protein [Mycobacterium pinniadriaticum]MCX2940879.1 aldehyde dehydrogenase family protein [Mycobacterium pinniadriaticum]
MSIHDRDEVYIGGSWRRSAGGVIEVQSAITGAVMGRVPDSTPPEVADAVAAARAAFPAWSQATVDSRLQYLTLLAKKVDDRADELTRLISCEVGTPLRVSTAVQVGLPRRVLESYRDLMARFELQERIGDSLVLREPIGVVAAITAWNYPLQQVLGKIAAALATGCTVVLKPSEVAPLSAFVVADIIDEIGLPPGVFNLVSGRGGTVGEELVAHPDVDMVTFTGSTVAGRRIGEVAARTVKRVALELGGKSANIILDDADLAQAVKVGVANCFTNTGQTCTALTRMLVSRTQLAQVEDLVRARLAAYTLGDPLDPSTTMGPLASAAQRDRVRDYIRVGIAEGADLIYGGLDEPTDVPTGFFVTPTAFSNVRQDMRIAREEIFGPVLSILPYDTEDDAVHIANDTEYGLAGAVWSADHDRALRIARRMRTGAVDINGSFFNMLAPFGGYKQSGNGRELGHYGLVEFYELKSVQGAPAEP